MLTFNEPAIAIGTQLSITDPTGAVISTEPPQLIDATVVQPLAGDLPAGEYTVQWRVVSADAHPITGAFTFVATGPAAPVAPTVEPDDGTAAALGTPSPPGSVAAANERQSTRAASDVPDVAGRPSFPLMPTALVVIAMIALIVALVLARAHRVLKRQDEGSPD